MPHWQPANDDLPASGVTAGTYGDATHSAQVTVSAGGLVTAAGNVPITGGGGGGGATLDLVTRSTALAVTATTAPTANTFIDGNAVTYDGSTLVKVELFCPYAAADNFMQVTLWDGATDLGAIAQTNDVSGSPIYCALFLTPSAGVHTFHVKAYRGTTFGDLQPGAGGSGVRVAAFYSVTTA